MENPKKQLLERLKGANNVLVTVSSNPSVDQLSAAIGLTLMLNKMDKHATAVFSGNVPSTIEFLQPEKTLEKNTDSLRDFIIALDKSKADKLRYKVEDSHVKIFITPYKTSITEADLEFSQGDFNVEVVVALGVTEQRDLDQAITAHGRILHDATTVSITTGAQSSLGSVNWVDSQVSSLCEMVASLANDLQPNLLDGQMATALLTGIVAETDRFSNDKTAAGTMSVSAALMAAGANQQLVASKLQEEQVVEVAAATEQVTDQPVIQEQHDIADGSLSIDHGSQPDMELPEIQEPSDTPIDEIKIDEDGSIQNLSEESQDSSDTPQEGESASFIQGGSSLILEPPSLGGKLTANSEPEHLDPATDPLAGGHDGPLLRHDEPQDDQNTQEPVSNEPIEQPPAPESESFSAPQEPKPVTDFAPAPEPPTPEPFVPPEQSDMPLPEPSMQLPSESPAVTPILTPSEQSIVRPEPPAVSTVETSNTDMSASQDEAPQTLSDLEASVRSAAEPVTVVESLIPDTPIQPALPDEPVTTEPSPAASLDTARDAVSDALASMQNQPLPPIEALNAQPLDLEIKQTGETGIIQDANVGAVDNQPFTMPENLVPDTGLPVDATAAPVDDPTAPPAVPPPFMPDNMNFGGPTSLPAADNSAPQQSNPQNPFGLPPA